MHRRRPGHRGGRRARLIERLARWLDRLVSRAARTPARAAPIESDQADALERAADRSGHVREAAVRTLAHAPRPEAIGVLLVRANDWVPQVRAAAAAALAAHLRDDLVPAWAAALGALAALRGTRRADHAALLAQIDAFLTAPERLARIVSATRDAPVALRRIVGALRRAAATDAGALARLLAEDAASDDIVSALAAVSAADALAALDLRAEVTRAALASPHAAVRRAAVVAALADAGTDRAARAALLARFAFDASGAVRGHVLAAAEPAERSAIADVSRWRLDLVAPSTLAADDQARAIALHNLVALAADDAVARCVASLAAPGAAMRAVALAAAWQAGDAGEREALLLSAFADPAPRVQRWAARTVVRNGLVPHWRDLLAIVVASPSTERARSVRRALARASPWWRLAFELALGKATGSHDAALLSRWCEDVERSFAAPPEGERLALALAWRAAAPNFDATVAAAVGARLARHGVIAD